MRIARWVACAFVTIGAVSPEPARAQVPIEIQCPSSTSAECTSPTGTAVGLDYTIVDEVGGVSMTVEFFISSASGPGPHATIPIESGPPGSTVINFFYESYLPGPQTVRAVASNSNGDSDECTITVTIVDTTAPTITCPDDVSVPADFPPEAPTGAFVTYPDPTGSDACDPELEFVCTPPSGSFFSIGTTEVVCTATDDSLNQSQCSFFVTVGDTTPPTIEASVGRRMLWPATRGMVDVRLEVSASDSVDESPFVFVQVFSDEDDGAPPYSPDASWDGEVLRLRAERQIGAGANGRVYLIVATAFDAAGNVATECLSVICPLNVTTSHLNALFAEAAEDEAQCDAGQLPPDYVPVGADEG